MDKTIVSGVITTGDLHLGNYLGAISNWVNLQNSNTGTNIFFLADLHSITTPQNPDELRNNILQIAITYLACGIDPNKCIIYKQSDLYTHVELAWILNCIAKIGWLGRMTQFKDKSGKDKENASVGLYTYPILQAADILQFSADIVPVGEDQKQHIELTRDIALAFNRNYNIDLFKAPDPYIIKQCARVMSLRDASKKMSKSDPSDHSRINLSDSPDEIVSKIKKATSDSFTISMDNIEERKELKNLTSIYASLTSDNYENVINNFEGKGFGDFKKSLAEVVVSAIGPISAKINELNNDKQEVLSILSAGAEKAARISIPFLSKIKDVIGFTI